jgi:type VI protein secretion system component VasK
MLAGGWAALLIIYRMFDKTSQVVSGLKITPGNEWGIFLALFAALWLAWTGLAMRRAHRAEPALADDPTVHLGPGGSEAPRGRRDERAGPVGARRGRRRDEDDPRRARRTLLPEDVEPGARPGDLPQDDEPHHEHRGVTREDAEQLSFELPEEH